MKRVMIVGASAWQVPAIEKAKELGYKVAVVDYNPNAVGIPYADTFYCVSTIDREGVCAAAKDFGADGITSVATDMPMRSIAYTCEKLGLVGISQKTAILATDKAQMIRAFEEHGVSHPWYFVVQDRDLDAVESRITYPCICKPTDNSASRGVVIVNSPEELRAAVTYSAENGRSGAVIIEELLEGSEISVEAFAVSGQIHILAITDKLTTGSPHFVEMGHSQPSRFAGQMKEKIEATAAAAMKAVGIENGPAHIEMMITSRGPVMIELGARLGGDFITTDLVPLSTGIDMLGATIQLACGEPVDLTPGKQMASAIRYMRTGTGSIAAVEGLAEAEETENIIRVSMLKSVGDRVGEITNSLDRAGYAIAQADTLERAAAACEEALKKANIILE